MTEKIRSTSQFDAQVILVLSEPEARALMAITEYGTKEFIKTFYECMGKSILEPHEAGIHSLFNTIKTELPQHLRKMDDVRGVWNGTKITMPKSLSK